MILQFHPIIFNVRNPLFFMGGFFVNKKNGTWRNIYFKMKKEYLMTFYSMRPMKISWTKIRFGAFLGICVVMQALVYNN